MNETNPRAMLEAFIHGFVLYGELEDIRPMGKGHINDTFLSTWNQAGTRTRYTHQRINEKVFTRPNEVMENIQAVTRHIASRLAAGGVSDRSRRVLEVVPAKDGKPWVRDREGGWWRTYCFIEGSRTGDTASSPSEAELLGKSVGRFQKLLADMGGARLHETIKNFHNMETRYVAFHKAFTGDEYNRAKEAVPEINFLIENEDRGGLLVRALRSGLIPERVSHNDAKLSNILLDEKTGEALCVIDLDTIMPGSSLFDIGDLIRTVTITAAEDEPDSSKAGFDPVFFRALLSGYLSEALDFLTGAEKQLLCESGRNMAHIQALRFCTDFLEGDHYFHTDRPNHNLDRCRTQIALVRSMDAKWREAEAISREIIGKK